MERLAVTENSGADAGALAAQVEKALQSGEERYRSLVLSIPAALYTTDHEGRITLFNDVAADMWGRRPEIGKDFWCGSWKIYNPDGTPLPHDKCPMAVALQEARSVRGREILVERPDGKRAWVLPHPEPLFDDSGKLIGALNMLVDISDRKAWEESLHRSNELLEERVLDRTAELEALCFSIAHDLRQHIRGVNTNARLIADVLPELDPEVHETIERLTGSARQMDRLVIDMLGYARLGRKPLALERVDVTRMAHEAAANVSGHYKGVEFRIEPGLVAMGDPSLVNIVVHNLVDNACKYSQGAKRPLVQIGSAEGALFVRDNGMGFDMKFVDQIFRPFERLHREEDISGTGIGLASVRRIAQRHGGYARAESSVGCGATFTVSFAPANG